MTEVTMYPTRTTTTTGTLRVPPPPPTHPTRAEAPATPTPPHPSRASAPTSAGSASPGVQGTAPPASPAPAAAQPATASAPTTSGFASPRAYSHPAPAEPAPAHAYPAWAVEPAAPDFVSPRPHRAAEAEPAPVPAYPVGAAEPAAGPAPASADFGVPRPHPVHAADRAEAHSWGVGAPREAVESGGAFAAASEPTASAETSIGWATAPTALLVEAEPAADGPPAPVGFELPTARVQADSEPVHPYAETAARTPVDTLSLRTDDGEPAIPHPQDPEPARPEPAPEPWPDLEFDRESDPEPDLAVGAAEEQGPAPEPPQDSGVPGPGVVEIVARAVARGLVQRQSAAEEEDDTQDIPRVGPHRGTAVTEVPVHLPFRGEPKPLPAPPGPATRPAPSTPRPAPGRRVPPGDERLREHRGPVLPGWIGVGVGGLALAGCAAVLWRAGAVPATVVAAFGATPRAYQGLRATHWPPLAFLGIVALLALGGLGRARAGHAWVLTLFGRYRGTVRRTGLTWVSPLLLRRRVDVRLRHWRSDPMPAVDSGGLALQVVVQVVWQVKDTARATLAVADHVDYLAEQVESAMARVLSQLPADAFHEDAPTLRDAEAVGDALTRMLAAETEAVGIEVFSAQPTRIEYAAEVAEAMRRRRVAAIDAKHRDTVLSSVVDAVDDTVHRLTSRGLVELDDYERKALVKDLTVAFYTGRAE
ncbi:SPFH domain-containing protein [Streptomyces sp. NPDC048337]|uniref:SPFH domain-containing protein n=1 Tax=Streptomyces sp. NPDC048337 TaxID=3365535 RepID=UPI00371F695C